MERQVAKLLAAGNAQTARDFIAAWGEHRNASWSDAHRDALTRSATGGHLPQVRGQLRYHLGEVAMQTAARAVGVGCIPMRTVQPGATFLIGRLGRFGLVNITVRNRVLMPRRSVTRRLLSRPNEHIDPQQVLGLGLTTPSEPSTTEIAYLGCLVAVPSASDPSVPSELALAVSDAGLRRWLAWTPLACLDAAGPLVRDAARPADHRIDPTQGRPANNTRPRLPQAAASKACRSDRGRERRDLGRRLTANEPGLKGRTTWVVRPRRDSSCGNALSRRARRAP